MDTRQPSQPVESAEEHRTPAQSTQAKKTQAKKTERLTESIRTNKLELDELERLVSRRVSILAS